VQRVVLIRLIWDHQAVALPRLPQFRSVHVMPEAGYPCGRKGLVLAAAWRQLGGPGTAGLVILDGDVMTDPHDLAAMLAAVEREPGAVHVAPVRLWPVSTGLDRWVWGHGKDAFTRELVTEGINKFGFSFTYLPRALMGAAVAAGLSRWQYPDVDQNMMRQRDRLGVPVRLVGDGCHPTHMNY
jgi:hypothetical protein